MKEVNLTNAGTVFMVLTILVYFLSPLLFIWSVNTLFQCGIPMSLKTWLAGFVLILLLRFHLRASVSTSEPYDDFYDEDDGDFYDDDDDDDEEYYEEPGKRKGNLIVYPKNRKNPSKKK